MPIYHFLWRAVPLTGMRLTPWIALCRTAGHAVSRTAAKADL